MRERERAVSEVQGGVREGRGRGGDESAQRVGRMK